MASNGDPDQIVFGRSATKSFQALPLIESGAADRFELPDDALAVALASHSGERQHVAAVTGSLTRAGRTEADLGCGPQAPFFSTPGADVRRIVNNCSGKHAGFLAVATHLGDDVGRYLDPTSRTQRLVRSAVAELTDVDEDALGIAIDGCSAPTFRMPLRSMATGIARVTNPADLSPVRAAACWRLTDAARQHPQLVGGSHKRIDSDILAATDGRLFPKIGVEAVEVVGAVGSGLGLAIKIDDGNERGFHALLIALLRHFDLLSDSETTLLDQWGSLVRRNWDGLEIGRTDIVLDGA